MNAAKIETYAAAGLAVAAVAVVLWVWNRGAKGASEDIVKAAIGVATGAAEGVVKGVGEAVGIPETDKTQCQRDLAAGSYWDASFSCPASDFVRGVFASPTHTGSPL